MDGAVDIGLGTARDPIRKGDEPGIVAVEMAEGLLRDSERDDHARERP